MQENVCERSTIGGAIFFLSQSLNAVMKKPKASANYFRHKKLKKNQTNLTNKNRLNWGQGQRITFELKKYANQQLSAQLLGI